MYVHLTLYAAVVILAAVLTFTGSSAPRHPPPYLTARPVQQSNLIID
jgi:hypothetical protein